MALVKCRECSGTVADDAAACPHCGTPKPWQAKAPKKVAKKAPKKVALSTQLRRKRAASAAKKAPKKAAKKAPAKKVVDVASKSIVQDCFLEREFEEARAKPESEKVWHFVGGKLYLTDPETPEEEEARLERLRKQPFLLREWGLNFYGFDWVIHAMWISTVVAFVALIIAIILDDSGGGSPYRKAKEDNGRTPGEHAEQLRLSDPDRLQPDTPRR